MDIYRHITPAFLSSRASLLSNAQVVIVDTNIPEESIVWLTENCRVPIFADPVSTVKGSKLRGVLGKLHTLKPNRLEAELLSGVTITDEASLHKAAETLLSTGLRRVFISLGADGVFAADHQGNTCRLPCGAVHPVNATGCGDAFMAAIAWAYLEGTDLEGTARLGRAASSIAMESAETINPALTAQEMQRRASIQ
jgi:pseudouridine kinase